MATTVLSVRQLAEEFGIARSTVYELVASGRIPHVKFGTTIRFRKEAIEAWIRSQEGSGAASGLEVPAYEAGMVRR